MPDERELSEQLDLGGLDTLLGFQLRMASAAGARDFAGMMGDLGVTQKQYAVLQLIEANAHVSQVDLAQALGADRATMMAVVDKLHARGVITRRSSDRDRRRHDLLLNPAGQSLLEEARRRIARQEARFVEGLCKTHAHELIRRLVEIQVFASEARVPQLD